MEKFTYDDVVKYSWRFEDVSEPMKEFIIAHDGSSQEASTSCTLMGVRKNGKWGWIDTNEHLVIPCMYDSGFTQAENGIIILCKDGLWGGLYRDNFSIAFTFKYTGIITQFHRDTFVVWNNRNRCALIKPGDIMLTGFDYKGFSKFNRGKITEYVRASFFGEVHGDIDLETGREIS